MSQVSSVKYSVLKAFNDRNTGEGHKVGGSFNTKGSDEKRIEQFESLGYIAKIEEKESTVNGKTN